MYKCSFFVSSHVSSSEFFILSEKISFVSKNTLLSALDRLLAQSLLGRCGAEQGLLASLLSAGLSYPGEDYVEGKKPSLVGSDMR